MNKLTKIQKKWLLSLHVFLMATWLGTTLSLLVLSMAIAGMQDSHSIHTAYDVMRVLYKALILFAGPGSAVTGLLLAVLTEWGLFRFYWLMTKEILVLFSGGLSIFGLSYLIRQGVVLTAESSVHSIAASTYTLNHTALSVGVVLQIISLTSILIISVLKPGGQIRPRS